MNRYSLTHLTDSALDSGLHSAADQERVSTVEFLAFLAEFDARKRYRQAGYPSLRAYCLARLHFSEDAAYKRIRAARTARRFPAIFEAIADGRLHLRAVLLLRPYLRRSNTAELIAAAAHGTRAEIELMLATRFPRSDVPTQLVPVGSPVSSGLELAPGPVETSSVAPNSKAATELPLRGVENELPDSVSTPVQSFEAYPKVTPLAPERFALQVTIDQSTREKLQRAQDLLGHRAPAGDVAQVLDLALSALIEKLEKRKFAATSKPRAGQPAGEATRHIPAHVKRAVWKRDCGQCTFKGADGHRCEARSDLEFDHVIPVARGGKSDVGNIRLLCRAHNQLEAERTYGSDFMESKRRAS